MDNMKNKIISLLKKSMQQNLSIVDLENKLKKIDSEASYEESTLGCLQGYDIHVSGYLVFYIENANNRSSLTRFQTELNKWYCPPPFFIVGEGDFSNKIHSLTSNDEFEELIFSILSPLNMATIYNKMILESPTLSNHKSVIFESMEAHWLGMDYVSTDSVVSIFESSLRELIELSGFERPNIKFQSHLRKLSLDRLKDRFDELNKYLWYPYKNSDFQYSLGNRGTDEENKFWVLLDHTMDSINAILIWFSDVLYAEYDESKDLFGLNRHNFFHGFSKREARPVYLPLMIWALLSIIYMERVFIKPGSDRKSVV